MKAVPTTDALTRGAGAHAPRPGRQALHLPQGGRRGRRRRRRGLRRPDRRRPAAGPRRRRRSATRDAPAAPTPSGRRCGQSDVQVRRRHPPAAPGALGAVRALRQRARRRAVGAVAGRPVLGRLQRPRLLGQRDLDVPDAARHRAGGRASRASQYRFDRLAAGRGLRRAPPAGPGARFPWESGALGRARRRRRSPTPASRGPRQRRHRAGRVAVLAGDRRPGLAGRAAGRCSRAIADYWVSAGPGPNGDGTY